MASFTRFGEVRGSSAWLGPEFEAPLGHQVWDPGHLVTCGVHTWVGVMKKLRVRELDRDPQEGFQRGWRSCARNETCQGSSLPSAHL